MWNNLKTTILLAVMTGLLLVIGELFGGQRGMIFALVLAAGMNLFSYFFSDKLALKMSGAKPIAREENPRIYQIVERLAAKANLPVPKIYYIPLIRRMLLPRAAIPTTLRWRSRPASWRFATTRKSKACWRMSSAT